MSARSGLAAIRVIRRQVIRAGLAAGVVVALAAGLTGAAQASTAGAAGVGAARAGVVSPAGEGPVQAVLYQVFCRGGRFCMAVGTSSTPGDPAVTLAEKWNGRHWRIVDDPLPGILATVTCGSPSFCMAERILPASRGLDVVEWNGGAWHTMENQPPDPSLVTCLSATLCTDLAGAEFYGWHDGRWQAMPASDACTRGTPGPCGWSSFICGRSAICIGRWFSGSVSGGAAFTAASGWNMSANVPFGSASGSCAGRAFCLITSGSAAQISQDVASPTVTWRDVSPDLAAICHGAPNCALGPNLSCGSPGFCMVLPDSAVVTLALNGTTWTTAPLARIHGVLPQFAEIACGNARNCVAVGSYQPAPNGPPLTAAEHWDGTAWHVTRTPNTPEPEGDPHR